MRNEVVADAPSAPTAAPVVGVVRVVTVDDDVRGISHAYRLVTTTDGASLVVNGAKAAQLLESGARYVLRGMLNGNAFDAADGA